MSSHAELAYEPHFPSFHAGYAVRGAEAAMEAPNQPTDLSSDVNPSQVTTPTDEENITVRMVIPDFDLELSIPVVYSRTSAEQGNATIKARLIDGAHLILGFIRNPQRPDTMVLDAINLEKTSETAMVDYVASTIWALIGLSREVSFELRGLGEPVSPQRLGFPVSTDTIATMMSRRQLAFWILAVESALGKNFDLPSYVTGDEIAIVSYLYQAVTVGEFNFPTDSITLDLPRTPDAEILLDHLRTETKFMFGPTPKSTTVFGTDIHIGIERVVIDKGRLANYEEAKENIHKDEEPIIPLVVIPHDGLALYKIDNAPLFQPELFDPIVHKLCDLTPRLVQEYFSRLEGLSTEELDSLLRHNRNETIATYTLALRYVKAKRFADAMALLRWHVRFPPDMAYFGGPGFYTEELCLLAAILLDSGEPISAERYVNTALLAKPSDANARILRDQILNAILVEMGQHAEYLGSALQALQLDDAHIDDLVTEVRKERFERLYSRDRQ